MRFLNNLFTCIRGGFTQLRGKTVVGLPTLNNYSRQKNFLMDKQPRKAQPTTVNTKTDTIIASNTSTNTHLVLRMPNENYIKDNSVALCNSLTQNKMTLYDNKYWTKSNSLDAFDSMVLQDAFNKLVEMFKNNTWLKVTGFGKQNYISQILISPTMIRLPPHYSTFGTNIDGIDIHYPTNIPNLPNFPSIMPQLPEEPKAEVEPTPKEVDCPEVIDNAPLLFSKKKDKKKGKKGKKDKKDKKKDGCKKVGNPCGKKKKKQKKKKTACDTMTEDDPCKPKGKSRCPKVPMPCDKK